MTSNLLKFVVRAIQYKHIRVIQLNERRRLEPDSTPWIYSLLIRELDVVIDGDELFRDISDTNVRKRIRQAGKELIKLFFSKNTESLDDNMFELAELYKQTAVQEAYKRLSRTILPMNEMMLALYNKYGFDESKIPKEYSEVLPSQHSCMMGSSDDPRAFMEQQRARVRVPLAVFDETVVAEPAFSQQGSASSDAPALAPALALSPAPVNPFLEQVAKAKEFVPSAPEEKDMTGSKQGGRSAHKNNNKKYTRKNKNQKRMKTVRRKNNKKSDTSKRNKKSLRVYRTKSLHRRRKAIS